MKFECIEGDVYKLNSKKVALETGIVYRRLTIEELLFLILKELKK